MRSAVDLFSLKSQLILLLFCCSTATAHSTNQLVEPRRSCLEHYYNNANSAGDISSVLPLISGDGEKSDDPVWLECQFPPFSSQSLQGSVTTVVHNALERWYTLEEQKRTIEYQIRDWNFLRELVKHSEDCTQQLYIKWPNAQQDAGSERGEVNNAGTFVSDDVVVFTKEQSQKFSSASRKIKDIEFALETMDGKSRIFRMNSTNLDSQSMEIVLLEEDEAPVMHIIPNASPPKIGSDKIEIRLTPLICSNPVISGGKQCLFEMVSQNEFIRLDIPVAIKKHPAATIFSFAFRTNIHNGKILSVGLKNGNQIDVDLVDGYLIMVNHIIHAVRFLSDGQWHTVYLDLVTMSLRFDGFAQTAISLLPSAFVHTAEHRREGFSLHEINILVNGEVTGIRLRQSPQDTGETLCSTSELLNVRQMLPGYVISLCSPGEEENSVCNCRGPNSAMNSGPGMTPCSMPKSESAYHLSRQSDKIAFFMIPNFVQKTPISVLFKSESETGLLLFGTTKIEGNKNGYGRAVSINRIQVHFVGRTMTVASCSRLSNGDELCYSCSIIHGKQINSGEWIRVSLFYHGNYQFMTMENQICLLSPNHANVDSSELYKVSQSVNNVLMIGGTYYAKSGALRKKINDGFRRDFHENTREKPHSLKGCIAEVRVGGNVLNLGDIFQQQVHRIVVNDEASAVFSMEAGCMACPSRCNGAPCENKRDLISDVTCNCGAIYAFLDPNSGTCRKPATADVDFSEQSSRIDSSTGVYSIHPMSQRQAVKLSISKDVYDSFLWPPEYLLETPTISQRSRKIVLEKIWLLIRFPELNSELHTFLQLGDIKVSVGDYGKLIVVEIEMQDYSIREEFTLPDSDSRLHLLSLELNPTIGTSELNRHVLTIRLDKNMRHLDLDEIPVYSTQNEKFSIHPYSVRSSDYKDGEISGEFWADRGGCVAELVLNYKPSDADTSRMHSLFEQQFLQIDYLPKIVENILNKITATTNKNSENTAENNEKRHIIVDHQQSLLLNKKACGIRDPLLWFGNSSSYGTLTNYNPSGSISNFSPFLTIVFIIILILLAVFLFFYCYKKQSRKHNRKHRTNNVEFNAERSEEKKPLKTVDVERQRWCSNSNSSNTETAYEDHTDEMLPTAMKSDPLIIDKLKSSPKSATARYRLQHQQPCRTSPQDQMPLSMSSAGESPYSVPSTQSSAASPTTSAIGVFPTSTESRPYVMRISPLIQQQQYDSNNNNNNAHAHQPSMAPIVSHEADEL